MRARSCLLLMIAVVAGPVSARPSAGPSTDISAKRLAEELVTLRSEVEALSEELETRRAEQREELSSLAQRKAEVESEARREELRIRRVDAALEEQRAAVAKAVDGERELTPAVLAAGDELRAHVRRGIPFQTEERLAAIDEVTSALAAGELSPTKAALRMWALHQDEARLVKESGLYRQPIDLDGERVLAEVARVGMVLLYFKTPSGVVGRAVKSGATWRYEVLTGADDVRRTEQLFDAFKKQLRAGWFELPVALSDIPLSDEPTPAAPAVDDEVTP